MAWFLPTFGFFVQEFVDDHVQLGLGRRGGLCVFRDFPLGLFAPDVLQFLWAVGELFEVIVVGRVSGVDVPGEGTVVLPGWSFQLALVCRVVVCWLGLVGDLGVAPLAVVASAVDAVDQASMAGVAHGISPFGGSVSSGGRYATVIMPFL